MRITDVRAVQPVTPDAPPDWRTSLGQILVAIDTDAGPTGYGVGGGGLAGIHVVRTVLRDLLLGRDPLSVMEISEDMLTTTLPFGRKGLAIMALSGVDLALWDLRGKAERQPVASLLGGEVGKPIPTYVTVRSEIPPELVGGHKAFKLHVEHCSDGRDVEAVVRALHQARQTVGLEAALMVDAWMRWDIDTALAVAEGLRELGVAWIEEPLPPDDWEGYALLAEQSPIPIAGGEHEFTADGFRPLIERRLHQVLQPDVCWCGGLTELIKIYRMAHDAGLRVCPHRGAELWALHAIAALDPEPLAESGRPWMTWVGGQPPIVDGYVVLGDAPGFGVEIDEDNLQLMWE